MMSLVPNHNAAGLPPRQLDKKVISITCPGCTNPLLLIGFEITWHTRFFVWSNVGEDVIECTHEGCGVAFYVDRNIIHSRDRTTKGKFAFWKLVDREEVTAE